MIPIRRTKDDYSLRPGLQEKHSKTLEWLSATMLWRNEFAFFQKAIENKSQTITTIEDKKRLDHFQNLIFYYRNELITDLRSSLRNHENKLA
ncbi:MAG: hypothetical protein ABIS36_00820, partial [Chryseolinea sp.]